MWNPLAKIMPLNLFPQRKPQRTVDAPAGRLPEPEGYASQVSRAPEPEGLGKVVAEMDADYQVAFGGRVLAANIGAIPVTISVDGGESDPRAAAIVDRLQTLWKDTVPAMLEAIGYGRKAFEKTWDYDAAQGVSYIRKLDGLEFEDSRLKLSEDGDFEGIAVKLKNDLWETIDPPNAWWLAMNPTGKYPHGRSAYFPALHEAWKGKRDAVKNLGLYVRRFAIRGGWAHIPFTQEDPQRPGQLIDTAAKTAEALEAFFSGGTGLLPNDLHPGNPEKYLYDFTEASPQGLDPSPLLTVIEQWDVAILRARGIPEKTVTEGDSTGSFAMVSQQMLTLFAVVESILTQFVTSFQRYVIDPTREMNYGEDRGPKFTMTFAKLTERPGALVADALKALLANPQFVQGALEGGVDLRQMLTDAGIPATDQLEEVMVSVAQRMAATQGAMAPAAPMANEAPAPGEFSSVSRQQWKRNTAAIADVLNGLKSGEISEVYALTMLQSLGLTQERAQALIDDARDGTINDPEMQGVGMANTAKPRGLGVAVPKQDALLREALAEYDALFEDLIDALAHGQNQRVAALREQILTLEAEMRTASRVLGMLSLWSPSINTYADGEARQVTQAIALANESGGFASRFPWLRRAFDWLAEKKIVKASDFAAMSAADKREVLSVPGVESVRTLKKIRTKLAKAIDTGEDFRTFRKAIEADVALSRTQTETLYRTNIKGGYVNGFETAMSHPAVADEFPYVMFKATADSRVRDEHWDMDGFVCAKTDPAYKTLLRLVKDYNCRCTLIPLSAEQASRYTVKTHDDIPAAVLSALAV